MSTCLVKGMVLNGRMSSPADKYIDSPTLPNDSDVENSYNTIHEILESNGELIIPEMIRDLPFIDYGFISASAAISCFALNRCLVASTYRPHFRGVAHLIQVAANAQEEKSIDALCNSLKAMTGWRCKQYWRPFRETKTVTVPDHLETFRHALPFLHKALQE